MYYLPSKGYEEQLQDTTKGSAPKSPSSVPLKKGESLSLSPADISRLGLGGCGDGGTSGIGPTVLTSLHIFSLWCPALAGAQQGEGEEGRKDTYRRRKKA